MGSIKQRGEKIMVIGIDEFIERDMELLNTAIHVFEGTGTDSDRCLYYALSKSEHELLHMSDGEPNTSLFGLDDQEFEPIRFMLACFVLLAYGEDF